MAFHICQRGRIRSFRKVGHGFSWVWTFCSQTFHNKSEVNGEKPLVGKASIKPIVEKTLIKDLFIYLGFYVAFNTVQVISRRVVGRAEETSTYSWSRFCTVNCRPTRSNYQLSHLRPCREPNPVLRGGR